MSSNWTVRTAVRGALVALALVSLSACTRSESNQNQIAPLQATIAINPVLDDPAVIFVKNSASTSSLVLLDVVLRSSAAVDFDGFTLEIHYNPGIVALGGDPADPGITQTPFGHCNEPDTTNCSSGPAFDPICTSSADLAQSTGELVIGVFANTGEGCPSVSFGGGQIKLMTIGFMPAGTGTSRIELVYNPAPSEHGDCEILSSLLGSPQEVSPPIPCVDGNATFTVTR
jgi:hypothetical protein